MADRKIEQYEIVFGHTYYPATNIVHGISESPEFWALETKNFVGVCLDIDGYCEFKYMKGVDEIFNYRIKNDLVYRFIEYTGLDGEHYVRNIVVDHVEKRIIVFRDYRDLGNGWQIYFNSKNNVVMQGPEPSGTNRTNSLKHYMHDGVDYFVLVSCMLNTIWNTDKTEVGSILPILNAKVDRSNNNG